MRPTCTIGHALGLLYLYTSSRTPVPTAAEVIMLHRSDFILGYFDVLVLDCCGNDIPYPDSADDVSQCPTCLSSFVIDA